MEMGWAEHDNNAARSPLSPKEGTWSLLLPSQLISEQIRNCWSPTGGKSSREKSSRNRTWPPTSQQKAWKDLSFRNQRQGVKAALS